MDFAPFFNLQKSENIMFRDFFYLQRNDRQAILALLSIIVLALTLVIVIGNSHEPNEAEARLQNDSTLIQNADKEHPLYYKVEEEIHELFPFDPNTADSAQLLRLGLQPWQVRSIYHYRARGGCYRMPEDFARLYGLTKKQFEVLRPYIRIADDYRPASDFYHSKPRHTRTYEPAKQEPTEEKPIYNYPHKLSQGQQLSVNSADTTELQKIPGIGKTYAKAIVRYRERLGGFTSSKQLLEIEGVPEGVTQFVTIDTNAIRKMNINQLTLNQLRQHPYINFYQAKAICDYRRLRGPIKSLQDLKLLKDFPPAEIERLQPYVSF